MAAITKTPSSREQKAEAVAAAAEAQPVAVYGPNLGSGTTFHVMSPTDRKKNIKLYKGHEPMLVEASSVQQVVEEVYADQIAEVER